MKHRAQWTVVGVAVVYLATLAWLPSDGHWIVDNGSRLIQVQALLANGCFDYSIPWPGRELDRELEYNPLPSPFSTVRNNRLYSIFSPVFPTLTAPLYAAFGHPGLYVIPLLASLALLMGLLHIARAARLPEPTGPAAVLVAGLASPVWFYSVVFWEHVVSACLAVWSVALLLDFLERRSGSSLVVSGLLCAAAIGFRDQLLLFAFVLVLLASAHSPGVRVRVALRFGTALAIGLLPLAVFQYGALGDPLGFHLIHGFSSPPPRSLVEKLVAHLLERPLVVYHLWLSLSGSAWSLLLTLPFLGLLWARPSARRQAFVSIAIAASLWALAGAAVMTAGLLRAPSPVLWLQNANGFYAGAPILILALLRCRELEEDTAAWRARRRLWWITALYALLYSALTPLRNATGLHWGNRYLLVLYPLLAVLCAANLVDIVRLMGGTRRWRLAPLVLGALATVGLQLQALDLLERKKAFTARLNQVVAERPEKSVVTDQWWIPQTLASEFFRRKMFFVETERRAGPLYERLARAGEIRFLFVTSAIAVGVAPGAIVVDDDGLDLFSVQLDSRRAPSGGRVGLAP